MPTEYNESSRIPVFNEELLFVSPSEEWLPAFEDLAAECRDLPEVYRPHLPKHTTMIELLIAHEKGQGLPEGYVPASHRWLVRKSDGKMLGLINIRHGLNAFISFRGGHIGYYIRESERGKGYATKMLALGLDYCRELVMDTVLITCDDANIGSYKVIEANGGKLVSTDRDGDGFLFRRYHIAIEKRDRMTKEEVAVLERLDQLAIKYRRIEHVPVFTVEDANLHCQFEEQGCKNLFLKDKKANRFYLVVMMEDKRANLKAIAAEVGSNGLTFAKPDELMSKMNLIPGAVTPFGLINNGEKDIVVLIDSDLAECADVSFHPNVNTATLILSYGDFVRFLVWQGNPCRQVKL